MRRGGGGGKDEEKVMGPLFPRLHVNDTNKGGPRAPPRNKMALYEQYSIPLQRFNSAAVSAPRHTHHHGAAGNTVPSTSSSQVGGHERPLFPSFYAPSNEPVRSSEKIDTHSINGRTVNPTRMESERQSIQLKDTNAAGSAAECSSQRREDNNIKNSSGTKSANDDDFMVPTLFCSGIPPYSTQEKVMAQEKSTPFCTASTHKSSLALSKSSAKSSNTDKKHLEGISVSDMRSRNSPRVNEKEPEQMLTNVEVKEKGSSIPASKEKLQKPLQNAKVSSNRDRVSTVNASDKQHSGNTGLYQARSRNENVVETQSPSKMRNALSSKLYPDIENSNRTYALPDRGLRESGEKRKRSAVHHNGEQKGDLSDSSLESIPGLEISPDDVVGAIGPKHFWKARRAIVNQQRVFAVQVFELHRLIKVQKLIAASPHLLIEADPCLGKALATSKNKLAEEDLKAQLPSDKNKDDTQPTLQQLERSKENTEGNRPSPPCDDELGGGRHDQTVTNGTFTSNPLAMLAAPDNKPNNWCVHPPQNQWLVPVMSPSEGLVYKPYAGSCPPAGSFLAPFYPNCAPLSLPSTAGDFMNSAYGVPIPHPPQLMGVPGAPPMAPNYFPPFGLSMMNPVASASAVEHVSHLAVSQPNRHIEQHSRSSCNMSQLRSEAFSGGIWRFHASMDSERQGGRATSPLDKMQGEGRDPLPLFPAVSAVNGQSQPSSGSRENPARVIRVVPHKARSATESAARIFQSIQMERQQNDS